VKGLQRGHVSYASSVSKSGTVGVDFNLSTARSHSVTESAPLSDDFWSQLENEVLILKEAIEKGQFSGIVETIDQYARQVSRVVITYTSYVVDVL
jgi:hypothetical protein